MWKSLKDSRESERTLEMSGLQGQEKGPGPGEEKGEMGMGMAVKVERQRIRRENAKGASKA